MAGPIASNVPNRASVRGLGVAVIAALLWTNASQAAGPYLYVANNAIGADSASVIDLNTHAVVATVPAGNRSLVAAVSSDGTRAYVDNSFADGITVIDTVTHTVVDTLFMPWISLAMVLHPDRPELYINTIGTDEVRVISTAGAPSEVISLGGPRPVQLAINATGSRLYTANAESDTVSVISTATRTVLSTFPVSDGPHDLRLKPIGSRLYVRGSAGIDVVNTGTNAVLSTIAGPASGFVLSPSGRELWRLTSSDLCVFDIRFDPPVPGPCSAVTVATPSGLAFNPSGTHLYVANRSNDEVLVFDVTQPPSFPVTTIAVGDEPVIGPQAVVATVGRDAMLGVGTWEGAILSTNGVGYLQLNLSFADTPLNVFGATINLGSLIGIAQLSAAIGSGSPPFSRALDPAQITGSIPLDIEDGTLRCGNVCLDNQVILTGRLVDAQGTFPPGIGLRIDGYLQAPVPLNENGVVDVSGTFTVAAVAHSNTPIGVNVAVHGGTDDTPVTVTYAGVNGEGATIIQVSSAPDGVVPADFDLAPLGLSPIYVSISTDANITPPITVCVGYPDNAWTDYSEDIPSGEPYAMQLWHSIDGGYREELTNRTIDTEANILCAEVDSLSPFAVAPSRPPRSGFVPPDSDTAKCESGIAKAAAKLAKAIGRCHTRAAADALAGRPPEEEACEAEARAAFAAKVAALQGCPPCAAAALAVIPDRIEQLMNGLSTGIYCEGPAALGGDSFVRIPPDRTSATCAKKIVRALGKRALALARCHLRAAKAALSGRPFDADACEEAAAAKFAETSTAGCVTCLSDGLFALGLQLESTLDRDNGLAYCAGTVPFP